MLSVTPGLCSVVDDKPHLIRNRYLPDLTPITNLLIEAQLSVCVWSGPLAPAVSTVRLLTPTPNENATKPYLPYLNRTLTNLELLFDCKEYPQSYLVA